MRHRLRELAYTLARFAHALPDFICRTGRALFKGLRPTLRGLAAFFGHGLREGLNALPGGARVFGGFARNLGGTAFQRLRPALSGFAGLGGNRLGELLNAHAGLARSLARRQGHRARVHVKRIAASLLARGFGSALLGRGGLAGARHLSRGRVLNAGRWQFNPVAGADTVHLEDNRAEKLLARFARSLRLAEFRCQLIKAGRGREIGVARQFLLGLPLDGAQFLKNHVHVAWKYVHVEGPIRSDLIQNSNQRVVAAIIVKHPRMSTRFARSRNEHPPGRTP